MTQYFILFTLTRLGAKSLLTVCIICALYTFKVEALHHDPEVSPLIVILMQRNRRRTLAVFVSLVSPTVIYVSVCSQSLLPELIS